MALTLRQTKLFPPPLRPDLVRRPRLLARLDQAQSPTCRAVIVTAPAGFGKTTLVRQWLASVERRTQSDPARALAERLVATFHSAHSASAAPDSGEAVLRSTLYALRLVEPLTSRELDLLRLIDAGLSNQAIAERLVLTVGTVKWHLNHLYAKLAVRGRTAALARARALGLLS